MKPLMMPRRYAGLVLLLLAGAATSSGAVPPDIPADADSTQELDATLTVSGHLLGAGVGYKWGRGALKYQGQKFEFCVRGMSLGDVGAARIVAAGDVFSLKSLDDFPGHYLAISTGVALVRGESASLLKNEHGVTIQLESKVEGLRFSIAASGLRIVLAHDHHCSGH